MVYAPTTQAIAIACGAAGAYVDVTADVMDAEGSLTFSWGTTDPLQAARPGQFTFILADPTGIYTPDNPVTTLGLPLTEGMGVSWQLNSRIIAGTIRSLELIFPSGAKPDAARVRVTCDDALGDLARGGTDPRSLRAQNIDANSTYHWPMDAPSGATSVFDTASASGVPMIVRGDRAAFGVEPIGGLYSWAKGVELNPSGVTSGRTTYLSATATGMPTAPLVTKRFSASVRPTREPGTPRTVLEITNTGIGPIRYLMGIPSAGTADTLSVGGASYNMPSSMQTLQAYDVALTFRPSTGVVTATISGDNGFTATVDNGVGVPFTTTSTQGINVGLDGCPIVVERVRVSGSTLDTSFGDTPTSLNVRTSQISILAGVTLAYVGSFADFSTRSCGEQEGSKSYLTDMTDALNVDGGRIYGGTTAGSTLTSPTRAAYLVPGLSARATTLTSAGTFSTLTDISGSPEIVRDSTNRLTQVVATSGTASIIVRDPQPGTLVTRSGSFYCPVYDPVELQAVASDQLRRARYSSARIRRITIDPRGTNGGVSRWADILALYPGARVRVADMPTTQFALGYWDGWFLGAEEVHTAQTNVFNIYLEPYLPAFVFDTARFAAGGELTLTAAITAAATSFQVSSSGTLFTTSVGEFPQKIIIDREVMTVTSVTGAASPQTFNVTRAATNTDGVTTLAATHAISAAVEIHPVTEFRL